ncbi:MAG: response regulator [Kofleriaceae bacterium]|nr:response regulator [Kofleriaceae bacterium]MBP6840641.1 response regulator [Kofleriaceae bacterium]
MKHHGLRSIQARVLLVVLAAGLVGAGGATLVAWRTMREVASAHMVEDTTRRVEQIHDQLEARTSIARAELAALARALAGGAAPATEAALAPFVVAARLSGDDDRLDITRTTSGHELLARASAEPALPLVDGHLVIRGVVDGVTLLGLVEVGTLLPNVADTTATLGPRLDPRLAVAGIVVDRRPGAAGEVARGRAAVDDQLELELTASLTGAKAEVDAALRRVVGWAVLVTVVVVIVLAWALTRRVTQPVRALASAVRAQPGPLQLPPLCDDEIGELGTAIATMHTRLAHDAHLLKVGADFARDVVHLRDQADVLRRLEDALRQAHPDNQWRVRGPDEAPPMLTASAAQSTTRLSIVTEHDGTLLLRPTDDDLAGCVAVGLGTLSDDDRRSLDVLCSTAAAAARNLALTQTATLNEKLALVGRISAGVAHEMNNPLAYVLLNLNLLDEQIEGAPRELVREAQGGVERLGRIVKDLSRVTRGSSDGDELVDLHALVDEQIKIARARAGAQAALVLRATGPAWVRCSAGRIGQAVLNIIVNGLDAAAGRHAVGDGLVEVELVTTADHHCVRIRDNGAGISDSARRHLFDAFFTTKAEAGTGLGLYLSRRFVQADRGRLEVVATDGAGTTFELALPVAAPPVEVASVEATAPAPVTTPPTAAPPVATPTSTGAPAVSPAAPDAPPARPRPRVLIIDDEPQIARTMERGLRRIADVTTATNSLAGLAAAQAEVFALILCDWNMPGMTGGELVAELRRSNPERISQVVIMSGGNIEVPDDVRVVAKPIPLAALQELVSAA